MALIQREYRKRKAEAEAAKQNASALTTANSGVSA